MPALLFLKSHVDGYTKKDGTYVSPHETRVVKKAPPAKAQFDHKAPLPPEAYEKVGMPAEEPPAQPSSRESAHTAAMEKIKQLTANPPPVENQPQKKKWKNSLHGGGPVGGQHAMSLFMKPAEPKHYPHAAIHPQANDDGKPVTINEPDHATPRETWVDPAAIATFTPGSEVPAELNGVPLEPWHDAPVDEEGWDEVDGQNENIEEPDFEPGKKQPAAGVIIQEPDGRIWLLRPTNGFGGYDATFPKGRIEHGMSMQASAIKEAFEETGLKVEITGYLGDVERTLTKARYYLARRVGGTPKAMGWEAQAVQLVPKDQLHAVLNAPIDRHVSRMAGAPHPKSPDHDEDELEDL